MIDPDVFILVLGFELLVFITAIVIVHKSYKRDVARIQNHLKLERVARQEVEKDRDILASQVAGKYVPSRNQAKFLN